MLFKPWVIISRENESCVLVDACYGERHLPKVTHHHPPAAFTFPDYTGITTVTQGVRFLLPVKAELVLSGSPCCLGPCILEPAIFVTHGISSRSYTYSLLTEFAP